MSKLRSVLVLTASMLVALAVGASSATAGAVDGWTGDPYTGPITGSIPHWVFEADMATWGSEDYPPYTGGTVTGEITDAGWPVQGTIDFDLELNPWESFWERIDTDGPYDFEIIEATSGDAQFTITEPVTLTLVPGAHFGFPDCDYTAPAGAINAPVGTRSDYMYMEIGADGAFESVSTGPACGDDPGLFGADIVFDKPVTLD